MLIGIDIDGVLADYSRGMHRLLHGEVDYPGGPTTYSMVEEGWFTDLDQWSVTHHSMTDKGLVATLDAISADDLAALREAAQERVVLVTARGHSAPEANENIRAQTLQWLKNAGITHRVIFAHDKTQCGLTHLLDDAPHNIIPAREAGIETTVFNQPYNQGVEGPRVNSVREFLENVLH